MTVYLTREEYENLKKELKYLKEVVRKEVAEKIREAVSFGDISENAAYDAATEMKINLELKIKELEKMLDEAVIVTRKSDKFILPGTSFEALNLETNKKYVFTLVGYGSVDPLQGKISTESPLGKAFLHKKPNDVVEVEVNGKKIRYKVLKILNGENNGKGDSSHVGRS